MKKTIYRTISILAIFLFSSISIADNIKIERCSGSVMITDWDGTPENNKLSVTLKRDDPNGYTQWSPPFENKDPGFIAVESMQPTKKFTFPYELDIRWWCQSEKGNWLDIGTWRPGIGDASSIIGCAAGIAGMGAGSIASSYATKTSEKILIKYAVSSKVKSVPNTVTNAMLADKAAKNGGLEPADVVSFIPIAGTVYDCATSVFSGTSAVAGWTQERSLHTRANPCRTSSGLVRARLGPDRLLEIQCLDKRPEKNVYLKLSFTDNLCLTQAPSGNVVQYPCVNAINQMLTVTPSEDKYKLKFKNNNKCLGFVSGKVTAVNCNNNNANISMSLASDGTPFSTTIIQNNNSTKCLNLPGTGANKDINAKNISGDCFKASVVLLPPKQGSLKFSHSNKCVGVLGNGVSDGDSIGQWDCYGGPEQKINLIPRGNNQYNLQFAESGKCMAVPASSHGDVGIIQYHCSDIKDQLVSITPSLDGEFNIKFQHSGKCLSVPGSSQDNGKQLIQYRCWNGKDQTLRFIESEQPAFALVSKHSNKCITEAAASNGNGGKLLQFGCSEQPNQKFQVTSAGDGFYKLKFSHSGKCLSVPGGNAGNGPWLDQWDCGNNDNQKVKLIPSSKHEGYFALRFKHSSKCVDINAWGKNDGEKIIQWECTGGNNQLFTFQ